MLSNHVKTHKKSSILVRKILEWMFVLYLFWGLNPYFIWKNVSGGYLESLYNIPVQMMFMAVVITLFPLIFKKINKSQAGDALYIIVCGIILIGVCGLNIRNLISGQWRSFIVLSLFILLDNETKVNIYNKYLMVFTVSLIPAIFYRVLLIAGVNIPYSIIESYEEIKSTTQVYYRHYPFAVQLVSSTWSGDILSHIRLCGMYHEAGLVGTMCGLFLSTEGFDLKNRKTNWILLIAGILSYSLAFVVIAFAYFTIKNICAKKIKNVALLMLIPVAYYIFTILPLSGSLATLQSRFTITNGGLVGDNRISNTFDTYYSKYISSSFLTKLLGFGSGSMGEIQAQHMVDNSSYKTLLYDYGLIGFIIIILWPIIYCLKHMKQTRDKSMLISICGIFLLNFYQRPIVFAPSYMVIFVAGICRYAKQKNISEVQTNAKCIYTSVAIQNRY